MVAANILQIAGWWTAILLAANALPWLGTAALALIFAVLLTLGSWTWKAAIATALAGTLTDLVLGMSGIVAHRAPLAGWLVVPWMTGLWLLVAPWLALGAPAILRRPLIGIPAIAGFSGVAYAGGAGLGAIALSPSPLVGGLIVAAATIPVGAVAVLAVNRWRPHA